MSGLEVVSLVTGIVPLLLFSLEHYDDLIQPLTRYKKFSSKIRDFHDSLYLERTIFRAECILILGKRVTRPQAEEMLGDTSHQTWRDETLNRVLSEMFGGMGDSCGIIMQRIVDLLGGISQRIQVFESAIDQSTAAHGEPKHSRRAVIRSKLKFSFMAYSSLEKDLVKLGKLNKTFITMSSQVRQLDNEWKTPSQPELQVSGSSRRQLQEYRCMRFAAIDLLQTLVHSRGRHHEHLLRFDLDDFKAIDRFKWPSVIVQFKLLFRQLSPCTDQQDQEAFQGGVTVKDRGGVTKELLVAIESALVNESGGRSSIVSGLTSSSGHDVPSSLQPSQIIGKATGGGETIALTPKLCHELSSILDSSRLESGSGVSFIEERVAAQHKVTTQQSTTCTETASLSLVLTQTTKKGRLIEMPLYHRLKIASRLGSSVLQLYETPWLHAKLNSDAIYFSSFATDLHEGTVSEPGNRTVRPLFIDLSLDSIEEKSKSVTEPAFCNAISDDKSQNAIGRPINGRPTNSWLFHLGILLLELAFHTPFSELLQEMEEEYMEKQIPLSSDAEEREYQIACDLAGNVSATLGAGYASVVRRCIHCDFFSGNSISLDDPSFQEQMIETVINKLENLAAGLQRV